MTKEQLDALENLLAEATPAPWDVYVQPVESRSHAAEELHDLVLGTPMFSAQLPMLTAPNGLCPAVTGVGTDGVPNAHAIVALRNAAPELLAGMRELEGLREERARLAEAWGRWTRLTECPTSVREVKAILDAIESETRGTATP